MGNRNALFEIDDVFMAKNYDNNKWVKSRVVKQLSPVTYLVETSDKLVWKRHIDQLLDCNLDFNVNKEPSDLIVKDVICFKNPVSESAHFNNNSLTSPNTTTNVDVDVNNEQLKNCDKNVNENRELKLNDNVTGDVNHKNVVNKSCIKNTVKALSNRSEIVSLEPRRSNRIPEPRIIPDM